MGYKLFFLTVAVQTAISAHSQADSSHTYVFRLYDASNNAIAVSDTFKYFITVKDNYLKFENSKIIAGKDKNEFIIQTSSSQFTGEMQVFRHYPARYLYMTIVSKEEKDTMRILVLNKSFYGAYTDEIVYTKGCFVLKFQTVLKDWGDGKSDNIMQLDEHSFNTHSNNAYKNKTVYKAYCGKNNYLQNETLKINFTYTGVQSFITDGACSAKIQYGILKKEGTLWRYIHPFPMVQMDCGLSYLNVPETMFINPMGVPGVYKLQWIDSEYEIWESNEINVIE